MRGWGEEIRKNLKFEIQIKEDLFIGSVQVENQKLITKKNSNFS